MVLFVLPLGEETNQCCLVVVTGLGHLRVHLPFVCASGVLLCVKSYMLTSFYQSHRRWIMCVCMRESEAVRERAGRREKEIRTNRWRERERASVRKRGESER